jgi:hypothetical protein
MLADNDNNPTISVHDLGLAELWVLVMSGQMPHARYLEIVAEREQARPRLVECIEVGA